MNKPIQITVSGAQGIGKTTLIMGLLAALEANNFPTPVRIQETNAPIEPVKGEVGYLYIPGEKP
jgi:GTPase SAR1 family protein